ncbi:MAG: DnaB-like helicase C-terminal domain-containing protein [Lachnospiraceae bacterium]|nr:DnaB-like helicase C-terminal domain-containing protein [Lachnospiraceae bacterium]
MRKKNVIITGFDAFDERVEMKPGQLILLAGRPAMGKTAFKGA